MTKRVQIFLTNEAQRLVDEQLKEANENFKSGNITISDLISEMVVNSKIDIKSLQLKRTDLRRSLRVMANQPDLDLDTIIKNLTELKSKTPKKPAKTPVQMEAQL